jgi:hypothetical protein
MLTNIEIGPVTKLPGVRAYFVQMTARQKGFRKKISIPCVWSNRDLRRQRSHVQVANLMIAIMQNGVACLNDIAEYREKRRHARTRR